jgi:hypothetical protein
MKVSELVAVLENCVIDIEIPGVSFELFIKNFLTPHGMVPKEISESLRNRDVYSVHILEGLYGMTRNGIEINGKTGFLIQCVLTAQEKKSQLEFIKLYEEYDKITDKERDYLKTRLRNKD